MGEIWTKKCEPKELTKDQLAQAAIVERGRELGLAVWGSLRMNVSAATALSPYCRLTQTLSARQDNHFNGAQPSQLATMDDVELTDMRAEHPEWLLGSDQTSEWFALSWNMAVAEVRGQRLAHVREMLRYDWDGIELDWQRHAFHLPEEEAYRLRYVLTDLARAVRLLCDQHAQERGRPLPIAARVAGSIEQSYRQGYDLEEWLREGLVDLLIPAGNAATDPSIDVAEWRELRERCGATDRVRIMPGFDSGVPRATAVGGDPEREHVAPEPAPVLQSLYTRALAARYRHAGADGLYCFNWHSGFAPNAVDGQYTFDGSRSLFQEIQDISTLRGLDKVYPATQRVIHKEGAWRGAFRVDRLWGQVPVPLLPTLTGRGARVKVDLGDESPTAAGSPRCTLRLRLEELTSPDRIDVRWDDEPLQEAAPSPAPAQAWTVSTTAWLFFPLSPDQVGAGAHVAEVILGHRNPQVRSEIMLTDVEVVVDWGAPPAIALGGSRL